MVGVRKQIVPCFVRDEPRGKAASNPEFFNNDPAARGTIKTTGFISQGKMSIGVFQFSAPKRHHPTGTPEAVRFGVSNVPCPPNLCRERVCQHLFRSDSEPPLAARLASEGRTYQDKQSVYHAIKNLMCLSRRLSDKPHRLCSLPARKNSDPK